MRALTGVFLAFMLATPFLAQDATHTAPIDVVTFTYENDQLTPSYYRLTIREDGTGTYESSGDIVPGTPPAALPHSRIQQAINISTPLMQTIVATARQHKFFAIRCETTSTGRIAFQGKKTLAYEGAQGTGSCTFNYSEIKPIQQLSDNLQAVASTIETGQRLTLEHQHDRLSLDAELAALKQSVSAGHSIELQNIRPVLDAIASDPSVLNRARQRAAALIAVGEKASK